MKKFDIITIGVPMVEFTCLEMDKSFSESSTYYGPVPAGDPGIALNACVRLGYKGSYVGVLGGDALAECFLAQMRRSGIDVSNFRVNLEKNTGLSLLTQLSDGSRKFVFTVPDSAAATINEDDLNVELLKNVRWIHISGFAMTISKSATRFHKKLVESVPNDVLISFDPNYRREIISLDDYLEACKEVFARCDYFLPSRGEAILYAGGANITEEEFCRRLSEQGKEVALKDGSKGAYAFSRGQIRFHPAYKVEEIDSTGAGDTFDGALIAATMDGRDLFSAAAYGNAAGAIAVTRRGLMDIAPTREDIADFLKSRQA